VTLFRQCVEDIAPEIKKKRLVQLCEIRRVERHDAIITFVPLYPSILEACIEKCQLLGTITLTQLPRLACLGTQFEIQGSLWLAVVALKNVLAITLPLCKDFSPVRCDISLLCSSAHGSAACNSVRHLACD